MQDDDGPLFDPEASGGLPPAPRLAVSGKQIREIIRLSAASAIQG